MQNLFIYDNAEMSISIIAKDEKAANKILKENVINPSLFTKETEMDLEDLQIN